MRLLAQREHSRLELKRKLVKRGFADSLIAVTLDRLQAEGALDESRLAAHYIAERADKGFGPLKIRAELQAKGLAPELIERHLQAMSDRWAEILKGVYLRRFGQTRPQDPNELARRVRFLKQRGFTSESIQRLLPDVD